VHKSYIKHIFLFSFFFLGSIYFSKADNKVLDSIKYYTQNNKGKLFGGFHNRNSFLGSIPIKLYGLRGGLEYGEKISYFLGLYTTYDVTDRYRIDSTSHPIHKDTFKRATNLTYMSVGAEYIIYQKKRWTFSIPLMVGIGTGVRKEYLNQTLNNKSRILVLPVESGVRGHFSITDWLGVEATSGLRISPFNSLEFTGFYNSLGINVYLGVLYKKVFKKEKK